MTRAEFVKLADVGMPEEIVAAFDELEAEVEALRAERDRLSEEVQRRRARCADLEMWWGESRNCALAAESLLAEAVGALEDIKKYATIGQAYERARALLAKVRP
jgi:predicted nuclease with TOPRIM domain